MKKKIISLLALMMMGGNAFAGNQPVISVADIEAKPGETVSFVVNLDAGKSDTYTAMTLYAQFPTEGFSTVSASVSDVWTQGTPSSVMTVVGDVNEEGLATIPFASANTISTTPADALVTINFKVAETVALGSYNITLKRSMFEYNYADKDYADDVTFSVNVVERHTMVLDETSTVAPADASDVNVTVKRTISAATWSTICLPFDMSEAQVKASFGSDVELAKFSSWSSSEDDEGNIVGINVGFTTVTEIEKNCPYIIKVSSPITQFTVESVNINPSIVVTEVGTKRKEKGTFTGTYVAETVVPEYNLFLKDNKFYYSNGKTKMKAYRGYFELYDVLESFENPSLSKGVNIMIDGDSTGVVGVKGKIQPDDGWYDLMGRKLPVNPTIQGIYMNNGKKVMVK